MLNRTSRILLVVAALLMLAPYRLPLWRIDLLAPQYPEGIGMLIRIDDVQGVKEQDLNNINGLNHYIGMKEIHAESIPELRYMPWLLAGLVAGALLVAAWGRRTALVAWLVAFLTLGVAGLVDFWRWSYDYGHDLDPEAIISVPGMSYQPPLIGTKQLLNFTAASWPSTGAIALGVAFGLGALAFWISRPGRREGSALAALPRNDGQGDVTPSAARNLPASAVDSARTATLLLLGVFLAACAPAAPRAVRLGQEPCGYCRMTITDARFGGQAATARGKVQAFDGIECLADYANALPDRAAVRFWVADFRHPGSFIPADSARIVHLEGAGSPMGAGLAAVRAGDVLAAAASQSWDELLAARTESSHAAR